MYRSFLSVLATAVLIAAAPAAEPPPAAPDVPAADLPATGAEPPVLAADTAFDKFLDQSMLAQAWASQDPSLLTDVALMLAEGERVLARPRADVPADRLIGLALQLAAAADDQPSLARLGKAAAARGGEWPARIAAAQKMAAGSRSVVGAGETPDQLLMAQAVAARVRAVVRLRDPAAAAALGAELNTLADEELSAGRKGAFMKQLAEVTAGPTANGPAAEPDTVIDKLQALSRGSNDVYLFGYRCRQKEAKTTTEAASSVQVLLNRLNVRYGSFPNIETRTAGAGPGKFNVTVFSHNPEYVWVVGDKATVDYWYAHFSGLKFAVSKSAMSGTRGRLNTIVLTKKVRDSFPPATVTLDVTPAKLIAKDGRGKVIAETTPSIITQDGGGFATAPKIVLTGGDNLVATGGGNLAVVGAIPPATYIVGK